MKTFANHPGRDFDPQPKATSDCSAVHNCCLFQERLGMYIHLITKWAWNHFSLSQLPVWGWRILKLIPYIPHHFKLYNAINASGFTFINKDFSKIPYKYLGKHLSYSMGLSSRYTALRHHYEFVGSCFKNKMAPTIIHNSLVLCTWGPPKQQVAIQLRIATTTMYEGELVLYYTYNNQHLYFLTFSIIPGHMFGFNDENIVFIGGNQGSKNCFHLIRCTTKENFDISPQTILITCLKAIATSMGIIKIIGISANNQVSIGRNNNSHDHLGNYDELWLASGGNQISDGNFLIPTHLHEKPISIIKRGHRIRTRKKRDFKHCIYDQILISLGNLINDNKIDTYSDNADYKIINNFGSNCL